MADYKEIPTAALSLSQKNTNGFNVALDWSPRDAALLPHARCLLFTLPITSQNWQPLLSSFSPERTPVLTLTQLTPPSVHGGSLVRPTGREGRREGRGGENETLGSVVGEIALLAMHVIFVWLWKWPLKSKWCLAFALNYSTPCPPYSMYILHQEQVLSISPYRCEGSVLSGPKRIHGDNKAGWR